MIYYTKFDKGVTTSRSFKSFDKCEEISIEMCKDILNYEIEKECDHRPNGDLIEGHFHLVRKDHDMVIGRVGVGNDFTIQQPITLAKLVEEAILPTFQNLKIEACGTLEGGATAFISLKANTFMVDGDTSPITQRITIFDPMTMGAIKIVPHVIRQSTNCSIGGSMVEKKDGTFKAVLDNAKAVHTASVAERVEASAKGFTKSFENIQKLGNMATKLSSVGLTPTMVNEIFDKCFPIYGVPTRSITRNSNIRQDIVSRLENGDWTKKTAWSLLCSYCEHLGSQSRKGMDDLHIEWDSMNGNRLTKKVEFTNAILDMI